MAWRTPMDAEIAALVGTGIDVVGIVVDVIDAACRREVVT
jgi:hypothetical protein